MGSKRASIFAVVVAAAGSLQAQAPPTGGSGRTEFARWLAEAPTSPLRAIAHQRIGEGLTLGPPGSNVVLERIPPTRVTQRGHGTIVRDSSGERPLSRGRTSGLGPYLLLVMGMPSRATLTVFGNRAVARAPAWFDLVPSAVDTVTLMPVPPARVTLLAPDGSDVEAFEAGTVTTTLFGTPVTLTVRGFPGASNEETELEIYFRDATNGFGSYPAGRFVTLTPAGGTRYVLDFNRARNPWCAYNTVFPCPPPWKGNSIPVRVAAGEKYGDEGKGKTVSGDR